MRVESRFAPSWGNSFAAAFLSAGRSEEAENELTALLEEESTDGAANLSMARVLVKQGKIPEGHLVLSPRDLRPLEINCGRASSHDAFRTYRLTGAAECEGRTLGRAVAASR